MSVSVDASDFAKRLLHQIAMDEQSARAMSHAIENLWTRWSPAHLLADCLAKRTVIAEVMSWTHFYLDEDTWFSCGLAVDPTEPDDEPGSGCSNDDDRGRCTCNLKGRQLDILIPLARRYGLKAE